MASTWQNTGYLYDDYFTLIINASRKPLRIDNIPLDDIEAAFRGDTYTSAECSSMKLSAPPKEMDMTFRHVHFFWR